MLLAKTRSHEHPVTVQRSLFPDEYELKAEALAALRALEVPKAMACTQRARKAGARLPDLDALEEALRWLLPRLQSGPPAQRLGAVLLAVAGEGLGGRLSRTAAAFVDEAVAHFAVHHCGHDHAFLDPEQQVPRALAQLLLGDAAGARRALIAVLDGGHRERGDLWAWLGDACVLEHRADECGPCYARALLFAPERVDLWRIREPRLAECHAALRRQHPDAAARALLFAQAWIDGALVIPANGVLEAVELDRLLAAHSAGPESPPQRRFRRFSLLLYRDRSRRGDVVELQSREEMAALVPELFPRFVQRCSDERVARRRP